MRTVGSLQSLCTWLGQGRGQCCRYCSRGLQSASPLASSSSSSWSSFLQPRQCSSRELTDPSTEELGYIIITSVQSEAHFSPTKDLKFMLSTEGLLRKSLYRLYEHLPTPSGPPSPATLQRAFCTEWIPPTSPTPTLEMSDTGGITGYQPSSLCQNLLRFI